MLRCTRLADLVNATDPKLAAAFGMNPEGALIYPADHVDEILLKNKSWPGKASCAASLWDALL